MTAAGILVAILAVSGLVATLLFWAWRAVGAQADRALDVWADEAAYGDSPAPAHRRGLDRHGDIPAVPAEFSLLHGAGE